MSFQDLAEPITDWRVGGLQNNSYPSAHSQNWSAPAVMLGLGVTDFTPRRFFVWSGAPPSPIAPGAGAAVHGVSGYANVVSGDPAAHTTTSLGLSACKGIPFKVETGGAFSGGGSLKTDSSGRAIAQGGSGTIIATALEASGAVGEFRWAVFA